MPHGSPCRASQTMSPAPGGATSGQMNARIDSRSHGSPSARRARVAHAHTNSDEGEALVKALGVRVKAERERRHGAQSSGRW
eukprot:5838017-Prymnesium_polylepis.1